MLSGADRPIQKSIPLIEQGQALEEIRAGDPEALSAAFWCSIQGIGQNMALYPEAHCPDPDMVLSILEKR